MEIPTTAVAGAGNWGKNIVRNLDRLGALACICDSSPHILEAYRQTYPNARLTQDYQEVLADDSIRSVAIASPAAMHGAMARHALEAGKDVFVEKPLCLSEAEGKALVGLAQKKGAVLMVGHLLHYHGAVMKLKELARSGELGEIYYIFSSRLNLGTFRKEENVVWSFAPHDISVILSLTSAMPDEVSCFGGGYLSGKLADVTLSSMGFPSGVRANIFVSWLHPYKEQKLVVVGSRKMAVFDDTEPSEKLLLYPHVINFRDGVPVPDKKDAVPVPYTCQEPLLAEMSHFLDCVGSRRTPVTDGAEGLGVLRVLQALQRSLDSGGARVAPASGRKPYFVHNTACVDLPCRIGEGSSVWHFSHVMKGAVIGKGCNLGQNVLVGPDAVVGDNVKIQNNVSVYKGITLEDDVFCGPSMVFTNVMNPRSAVPRKDEFMPTLVKKGATLGANCTIVCGSTIGRYAFVGAGAVVTKDVPDHAIVVGNPARVTGWMCECGQKIEFDPDNAVCTRCGAEYEKSGNAVKRRVSIERTVA